MPAAEAPTKICTTYAAQNIDIFGQNSSKGQRIATCNETVEIAIDLTYLTVVQQLAGLLEPLRL